MTTYKNLFGSGCARLGYSEKLTVRGVTVILLTIFMFI